jgi:Bacterial PH domain
MKLPGLSTGPPASLGQYLLPYERRVVTVRMHPAVLAGPVSLSLAGFLAAGLLTAGVVDVNTIALSITWAACILLLLYLAVRAVGWWTELLVVTNTRMILITGLVARKVSTMRLRKITDMTLRRSRWGRLLGYGTFYLQEQGQDHTLQMLNFMPYPEQIFMEVRDLLLPAEEDTPEPEPQEFT